MASVRRRRITPGRIALGALAVPLSVAAAAGVGYGAGRALGLDPVLRPWVASPGPLVASFFLAGLAGALLPALLAGRMAGPDGLRAAVRLWLAGGAVALAATLPGASFVLLVPALAAIAGLDLATVVAAGLVLFPPAWLLYPALGHAAGPAVAAVVAIAALPLAPLTAALPLRARALAVAAPLALSGSALAIALALPVADRDAPERLVVYFHQEAGRARILASSDLGRLPPEVRAAAPFSESAEVRLGWGTLRPSFEAPAAPLPMAGPEVEVLELAREGDVFRWRARLRSPRGAAEIQVAIPPSANVRAFTFDGAVVPAPVPKLARWYGGWWVYRFPARPEGIEVELVAEAAVPVDLVVADQSPGLPPAAAAIAAARPPWVVTQQEGDVTLFTRRLRIGASAPNVR